MVHPAGTTLLFAQSNLKPGFALFSNPVLAVFPRLLEAPFLLFSLKTVWANSLKVERHARSICSCFSCVSLSASCLSRVRLFLAALFVVPFDVALSPRTTHGRR